MKFSVSEYTCSKNDVILSVRKHRCALGLVLGLAKIRFWSNLFSSKRSWSKFFYSHELHSTTVVNNLTKDIFAASQV